MGTSYKQLAAWDAGSTEGELYVVPSGTTVIGTLNICNRTSSGVTYQIAHTAVRGAAASGEWLVYQKTIAANDVHQITGISMGTTETLRVLSGTTGAVNFVFSGMIMT